METNRQLSFRADSFQSPLAGLYFLDTTIVLLTPTIVYYFYNEFYSAKSVWTRVTVSEGMLAQTVQVSL